MFGMLGIAPFAHTARVIAPVEPEKLCVDSRVRLVRERFRIWLRRSRRQVLRVVTPQQQIRREFL
jgi:hypothetical protein